MQLERQKTSAHIIIPSSALAAAIWSLVSAILPGVAAVTDTAGGIIIAVAMTSALGNIFNRSLLESPNRAFFSGVIGREVGLIVLKGFFSFLPAFGPPTNAIISFGLTEAIGWSLFLIFDEAFAEQVKKSGEFAWIDELPPHIKAQYDYLTQKLDDRNLSPEERQATLKEIEDLIAPYNPKQRG